MIGDPSVLQDYGPLNYGRSRGSYLRIGLSSGRWESSSNMPKRSWMSCGLLASGCSTELGERIRSFKGSWEAAVKKAGVPNLRFDDFRRSGVGNLVRAKVPESVAMKISGHKARAIFDRYDIRSEGDLADAAAKLAAFRSAKKELDSDLNSAKNRDSATKTPAAIGVADGG